MKKLLIILTILLIPFSVTAQQSKKKQSPLPLAKYYDNVNLPLTLKERSQIIEVYGKFADKYIFNNPHRLKSVKHILRNRVVIKLITNENDQKECPKLSEIALLNEYVSDIKRDETFKVNNFNPLKYNFEYHSRFGSIYKVDNTNYYIIIKSQYQ